MARREQDGEPRKRFTKTGHTTHRLPVTPDQPTRSVPNPPPGPQAPQQPPQQASQQPPPPRYVQPPRQAPPPSYDPPRYGPAPQYGPPQYGPPQYGPPQYGPPQYGTRPDPTEQYPPGYRTGPGAPDPGYGTQAYGAPGYDRPGYERDFGSATYHGGDPEPPLSHDTPPQPRTVGTAAKATAVGTGRAARFVTRKVILASKANGAHESGLTALIWNQVLSYGTDAMITVALASTVFFGASAHAQRGHVLVYLLVTMAPFAVVAPIIGPALDRLQHGRRWAMAGSAVGRAILAIIMAGHSTDLLVLYPCALGSLVLSKAYSVIRAAAAPRLVPPEMTLVEANARLTVFGLAAATVGGGLIGVIIKVTGSGAVGLWVTAIAFGACGYFAIRLPKQIDSASPAPRHPEEPARPRTQQKVPPMARIQGWAKKGFIPPVILSLQGESALRFMAGFLTIFMAFWIEQTRHGLAAAAALGAVLGAAGLGNFVGTFLGARLKLTRPDMVILICTGIAAACCVLAAVLFSIDFAVFGMLVSASCNALAKIALDAVIQRDVSETLRSSAFARSETFLQLAWVLGAAIGCLLPASNGSLGFWISGASVGAIAIFLLLRQRALSRATSARQHPEPPGNLAAGPY